MHAVAADRWMHWVLAQAGPSRRSAFGLEDGLIVAVCACCALLDQVAGPLLEPSFGPAFARQGQWAWRAVGAAGAAAGVALGGPRPPSARRSAAAEHGWSALLWASAAYAAMLLPLSKLAGGALAARTGGVHSLEADAQLAGAVLLGPLLAALAFYAAAHIAHGAVLPGVAILAPGGTLAAVLLRMAPLPPYPVGVSLNLVALLAGLCALARLPLRYALAPSPLYPHMSPCTSRPNCAWIPTPARHPSIPSPAPSTGQTRPCSAPPPPSLP